MTVGPDSAGAFPGPVCYGRGGTVPTLTDAEDAKLRKAATTTRQATRPKREQKAAETRRR